jgi:hypothetical protein
MKRLIAVSAAVAAVGAAAAPRRRHVRAATVKVRRSFGPVRTTAPRWACVSDLTHVQGVAASPAGIPGLSLWPLPRIVSVGSSAAPQSVDVGGFMFTLPPTVPPSSPAGVLLTNAFQRVLSEMALDSAWPPVAPPSAVALSAVVVTPASLDTTLDLGVDESYALTLPGNSSIGALTCNTVYGCLHGLQVRPDEWAGRHVGSCALHASSDPSLASRGCIGCCTLNTPPSTHVCHGRVPLGACGVRAAPPCPPARHSCVLSAARSADCIPMHRAAYGECVAPSALGSRLLPAWLVVAAWQAAPQTPTSYAGAVFTARRTASCHHHLRRGPPSGAPHATCSGP